MALLVSGVSCSVYSWRRQAVRGIAAGDLAKVKSEEDKIKLGGSDLRVSKLGIGAWAWGDTSYWNDFQWDALPWRLGRESVLSALKDSLSRIGLQSVDLYQLHWPGIWGNEGYIDGLGDAVEKGLVKAVGVSNYNEKRLRAAYNQLKKRGIPLASNQVNYSLIYRAPEQNGVKAACDELGITLIAYSPIAQGILTGKYTPEKPPTGPRGRIYTPEFLTKLQPLLNRIKEIGNKYNKSPTQVVLNWLVAQGNVVPIPGAKNGEQATEFAGALGWQLTEDETSELRTVASVINPVVGFPAEKL